MDKAINSEVNMSKKQMNKEELEAEVERLKVEKEATQLRADIAKIKSESPTLKDGSNDIAGSAISGAGKIWKGLMRWGDSMWEADKPKKKPTQT